MSKKSYKREWESPFSKGEEDGFERIFQEKTKMVRTKMRGSGEVIRVINLIFRHLKLAGNRFLMSAS